MRKNFHALLVGNGETLPADFLTSCSSQVDFVLATDGGADRALAGGILPDAVIGDLDSVSQEARKKLADKPFIFVDNQNNTDLEKALDYLLAQGCSRVTVVGFTGGRMDFTLGNLLSVYPYTANMKIRFASPEWEIFPLFKSASFRCKKGVRVSLIPLKTCRGVSLQGLKYPLKNASLSWKQAGRALSNRAVSTRFHIHLISGFMLVYIENTVQN